MRMSLTCTRVFASLQLRTYIEPRSNLRVPYIPQGWFLHVPLMLPTTASGMSPDKPWWADDKYVVGKVTQRARFVRIINTLTSQEHVVEFCGEDTVAEMQRKFFVYNSHCQSYAWKVWSGAAFRPLDAKRSLEENGVPDDAEELERLGLDPMHPDNMTTISLFFADDLTIA